MTFEKSRRNKRKFVFTKVGNLGTTNLEKTVSPRAPRAPRSPRSPLFTFCVLCITSVFQKWELGNSGTGILVKTRALCSPRSPRALLPPPVPQNYGQTIESTQKVNNFVFHKPELSFNTWNSILLNESTTNSIEKTKSALLLLPVPIDEPTHKGIPGNWKKESQIKYDEQTLLNNRTLLENELKSTIYMISHFRKKKKFFPSEKRMMGKLISKRNQLEKTIKQISKEMNNLLTDTKRLSQNEVADFTKKVLDMTLDRFEHDLNILEGMVEDIFEKSLERYFLHPPAPRIDPWYSAFERYPNAYSWNVYWHKVMTWPTTLWPELSSLFNLVVSEDLRDFVFYTMKDQMPYRAGTKKSFFSVNRKKGIVTIPFPTRYKVNADYPRLSGYSEEMYQEDIKKNEEVVFNRQLGSKTHEPRPCSTLFSTDKNYKKIIIGFINKGLEKKGLSLYEWDLAACHTKILVSLFPEQTPIIRKVLEKDESIWDEFSRSFPDEIIKDIGGRSVLKSWSKIVAYKCLQGGSVTHDGIKSSLLPKGLSEVDFPKQELILNLFANNPVLKEFNTLNQTLQDRRYLTRHLTDKRLKVYHPTSLTIVLLDNEIDTKGSGDTAKLCRIASQVVVGGENWVLMIALEVIRSNKLPVIPVSLEYDGMMVLSRIETASSSLEALNKSLVPLMKVANLFPINFEQK